MNEADMILRTIIERFHPDYLDGKLKLYDAALKEAEKTGDGEKTIVLLDHAYQIIRFFKNQLKEFVDHEETD